jgi:hypothetical protein
MWAKVAGPERAEEKSSYQLDQLKPVMTLTSRGADSVPITVFGFFRAKADLNILTKYMHTKLMDFNSFNETRYVGVFSGGRSKIKNI